MSFQSFFRVGDAGKTLQWSPSIDKREEGESNNGGGASNSSSNSISDAVASSTARLSPRADVAADIDEYREVFVFYDTDRDGRLTGDELVSALVSLGHALTRAESAALRRQVERSFGSALTFPQFIKLISTQIEPREHQPQMRAPAVKEALATFNEIYRNESTIQRSGESEADFIARFDEAGTSISVADLHMILTKHGDPISDREFLNLLKVIKLKESTRGSNNTSGGGGGGGGGGAGRKSSKGYVDLIGEGGEQLVAGFSRRVIFLPNRLADRAGADARVDVSDLTEAVLGKKR
jgi:Ca2+-binding EF-hand superfamily protein